MKLPFTLHHASLKGCQGGQGCHTPLKIPGQVFLFTFRLREGGVGGKDRRRERKEKAWATWKNHDLKKAETCPEGSGGM